MVRSFIRINDICGSISYAFEHMAHKSDQCIATVMVYYHKTLATTGAGLSSEMRQDPIESYIFGNGGVESAMGTVGVESRDTEGISGAGAVLRDESFTNESCIKRTFLGVGLQWSPKGLHKVCAWPL